MPNLQLSENLRRLRKSNQLKQAEISVMLNISRQAYSNYENNQRSPDLDSLIFLSQLYGITLDQLVNQTVSDTISERKCPFYLAMDIKTADTLYLTEDEINLVFHYRSNSEENRKLANKILE